MFDHAITSDRGPRSENEDSAGIWSLDDGGCAIAVADGLGGHVGGKRASSLAIELVGNALSASSQPDPTKLAREIHEALHAAQIAEPSFRGMATTLSAAFLTGGTMRTLHCGDTRIVLQRGNGIKRLTRDQTEAQRLLEAGKLTKKEFFAYPRKNILESALGAARDPKIDVDSHPLLPGDRVIITSDGVHGKLYLREMKDLIDRANCADDFVRSVMAAVRDRSPEDNFTIAAVFVS